MVKRAERPKLSKASAALLGLMERYLAGLMDVQVTLLEIHKLLYFLQQSGEASLKLRYKPGPYGPYAENLRHVLSHLEGHYIVGYGEGGDAPEKAIELVEGAADEARAVLRDHPDTHERYRQVGRLIAGFESPYGMELLATVHWVADRQGAKTFEDAVSKVDAWSQRKTTFTQHQIRAAWDRLDQLEWLRGHNRADGSKGAGPGKAHHPVPDR